MSGSFVKEIFLVVLGLYGVLVRLLLGHLGFFALLGLFGLLNLLGFRDFLGFLSFFGFFRLNYVLKHLGLGLNGYGLLCGGLRKLGDRLNGHGLLGGDHLLVGGLSVGIVALGVAHLGDLDGLANDLGSGSGLLGRGRIGFGFGLHLGLGGRLGLNRDGNLLGSLLLLGHYVIVKLPGEVCVCGNHALVLVGNAGHVIGRQLKGGGGLFLANVFLNQLAGNQALGALKGIQRLIVDLLNINGRESVLLAGALNQLHGPLELTGGAKLVEEGCVGILLFGSHVLTTVNGALQGLGLQSKVELQNVGLDVDLCDLGASVVEAVGGPADAALGSLVGKERVLQLAVVLLDAGARLDQLGLKALAVVSHDVASRCLVKSNDALVARKAILAIGLLVVNIVLLALGLLAVLKIVVLVDLILVVKLLVLGVGCVLGKGGNTSILALLGGLLIGLLALLQLVVQKVGQLFHQLLGSGIGLLRGCSGNLANDLLLGLGNDLLHDLVGTVATDGFTRRSRGSLYGRLADDGRQKLGHGGLLGGLLGRALLCVKDVKGSFLLGRLLNEGLLSPYRGIGLLTLLLLGGGIGLGGLLFMGRLVLLLRQRRHVPRGQEGIALDPNHDQKNQKENGNKSHNPRQNGKRSEGSCGNGTQKNECRTVMILVGGIPRAIRLGVRIGMTHLAQQNQNARHQGTQKAGQQD